MPHRPITRLLPLFLAMTFGFTVASSAAPAAYADGLASGAATRPVQATDARHALLSLINQTRRRHGLRPAKLAERASRAADQHSEKMARRGRVFSTRSGYPYAQWGENTSCGRSIEQVHEKVMAHANSRANVLSESFRRVGIGVARSDPRRRVCRRATVWVTEVFFQGR
jgi:uncharacterized protein YkwD